MTTLVDVSQDAGDSRRASADLSAEAAELNKSAKQNATAKSTDSTVTNDDPRFAGKGREDILDMYRNLETHTGRLANELGQQRRSIDELLQAKRASDLQSNGSPNPATDVTVTDLLERPTEAVTRVVDERSRTTIQPLENRLNSIEERLAASAVANKHGANWESIVKSSAFQTWASKTPLRMNLVAAARNGNWDAADGLLSEYRASTASVSPANDSVTNDAQRAANRAALEGTQSGSDGGSTASSGKKYKRADIWALRVNDPDTYEKPDVQAALMRAYREGRVID